MTAERFQTFSEFSSQFLGPHKTTMGIFEISSYLENKRSESKTEWNLGFVESTSTYMGYLCPSGVQSRFGGHSVHFRFLQYNFQNSASSTPEILLQPHFSQLILLTAHIKVAFWNFEISIFLKFENKNWNLTLWPMGKWKRANIFELAKSRAKQSELLGLGVLKEHIWDNFDFVMFKIILGSFGALNTFPKIRFCIAASSKLMILFSSQIFCLFPACDMRDHPESNPMENLDFWHDFTIAFTSNT